MHYRQGAWAPCFAEDAGVIWSVLQNFYAIYHSLLRTIAPMQGRPKPNEWGSTPGDRAAEVPPAIAVRGVSFQWSSDRPVLKDCSLAVPPGEFWMLLGTNGSGKSTLMQLLAGLRQPAAGEVLLRRPVGFVFQNPDRQLVMPTVGSDVAFGLAEENLSEIETRDRIRSALAELNVLELERRPIYALSGGQKQRVAIAGAIATRCEVLLLDEPTALLDPDSQLDLVRCVRQLVDDRGIAALWVTHRLDELDYCDGAFLLENGRVVASGKPAAMRDRLLASQSAL